MMQPNSQNQRWSKWIFEVGIRGKDIRVLRMEELKLNMSAFVKTLFHSSAGQMQITPKRGGVTISLLIEGSDIVPHDPAFQAWVRNRATAFFTQTLGSGARVSVEGKLMAGSQQDGTPAEQMLIMPSIRND